MNLRELTEADLPALAELCGRGLADPTDAPLLRRLFLGDPGFTPAYHLCVADGAGLAGAILGSVREQPEGRYGGVRLLVVDPQQRRRGLGGRLLVELERRMAAGGLAAIRAGVAPNWLWPGVDLRLHTPAFCFFERQGYERSGEAVNMDVDLLARDWAAELAALPLADGWQVRRATPADRDATLEWVAAHWSEGWRFEAELAFAAPAPTIALAVRGPEVGGFACWDVSGLWGTFGPTGTAEPLRGRGLGKALLLAALAALREAGHRRAEIGWTGPIAFYARAAGATIGRVCWFMSKSLAR